MREGLPANLQSYPATPFRLTVSPPAASVKIAKANPGEVPSGEQQLCHPDGRARPPAPEALTP